MLHKLAPLAKTVAATTRPRMVRTMGGIPAGWKSDKEIDMENKNHMNFMPVPAGPWQEHYNKRNTKWNIQLAASTLFVIATVICMQQTGCWYLHSAPSMKN